MPVQNRVLAGLTSKMVASSESTPHVPPIRTVDLAGPGGHVGQEPEDFCVDEVPLYTQSGAGAHLFVKIRKRAWTTPDAVGAVARAANVHARDIGFAGMKDRWAVTTQWLSLPLRDAVPPERWQLPDGIEVLDTGVHGNKLRTGHLLGNAFRVRVVDVDDDALTRATAILERLQAQGLVNYFGSQRFGRHGRNLAEAIGWIRGEGPRKKTGRFAQKLWPSVLQAEVFNRYATARCGIGTDRLIRGEVVRLEGTGSFFVVVDSEKESSRLAANDIHLTGPIVGPKMRTADGDALELERRATAELGLSSSELDRLGRFASGTRRDLLVRPSSLRVIAEANALVLEFFLPSGSYATQLLRELTRAPFIDPHSENRSVS